VKYAGLTISKTFWRCSSEECIETATESVFSSVEGRTFHDWILVSIVPLEKPPTLFTVILRLCVKWIQTDSMVSKCFQVASDTTQHNRTSGLFGKFPYLVKKKNSENLLNPIFVENVDCAGKKYCKPTIGYEEDPPIYWSSNRSVYRRES